MPIKLKQIFDLPGYLLNYTTIGIPWKYSNLQSMIVIY